MHYTQREKYEIIRLVEDSDLGVIRTLKELKINKKQPFICGTNHIQKMGMMA